MNESINQLFAGLTWHPGGKYLLSVSDDKSLRVWDIAHTRCHKRLDAHTHFATSIGEHIVDCVRACALCTSYTVLYSR